MITSIVHGALRLMVAVRIRYWNAAGRLWLRLLGVRLGRGVSLLGFPIISIAPGSTISLGDKVVLCSDSRHTALGVSRPVVLRTLAPGAEIRIGDDTGASGLAVCAAQRVTIGRRCLIGADVKIFDTDFHAIAPEGRRYGTGASVAVAAVEIGDDVFIGAGAVILKGVAIGTGSVIAAGSVVTRDVPPMAIASGVPARVCGAVDGRLQRSAV